MYIATCQVIKDFKDIIQAIQGKSECNNYER